MKNPKKMKDMKDTKAMNSVKKRQAAFFLFLIFYSAFVGAGLYQCVDEKGSVEYRDSPCGTSSETFLPIQYSKSNTHKTANTIKNDKEAKKLEKQREVQFRKEIREKQRWLKQNQIFNEKEKRRQARCLRTREKIAEIEHKMRAGRKLKGYQRLQEELEHHQRMERRHCDLNNL